MKKLRLALDGLRVESFETERKADGAERRVGTIFGAIFTKTADSCVPYYTCPECYQPDTDGCSANCTPNCVWP